MYKRLRYKLMIVLAAAIVFTGCASNKPAAPAPEITETMVEYLIGPGDELEVFVWRNPDLSTSIPVRPDGKISTPLIEDMQAVGKSPTFPKCFRSRKGSMK